MLASQSLGLLEIARNPEEAVRVSIGKLLRYFQTRSVVEGEEGITLSNGTSGFHG